MTIEAPPGLIVGFVLALVRASAFVAIAPPFATKGIPSQVKVGLAGGLALAAAPRLQDAAPPVDVGSLIGAIVTQVFIGLTLGFLTMLLFTAVQAAGDLIDLMGGLSIAQLIDPISQNHSSVFGRFYSLLAVTLLFAVDGHLLMVRGFMHSFDVVSLSLPPVEEVSGLFIRSLGSFMVAAIEIGIPILGALFVAEVALGLLARVAPQMNVFIIGMPFKVMLTFLLAGAALPLLPGGVSSMVESGVRSGAEFLRMVGPG